MTNERNSNIQDGATDERVAAVYREFATERTPEQLDRKILQQAAKAARPAYKRSILWTRPVAWAAVVAICLAITLQVTQLPVPSDVPELDALERGDLAPAQDDDKSLASDAPAPRPDARNAEARTLSADSVPQPTTPLEARPEEAPAPLAEDFEMQDRELLQHAETLRRQRSGDSQEAEPAALGVSAFTPTSATASLEAASCTDADRNDPDTWMLCIVLLEQAGRDDEAATERELLAETFPDFEVPARTE